MSVAGESFKGRKKENAKRLKETQQYTAFILGRSDTRYESGSKEERDISFYEPHGKRYFSDGGS